MRKKSLATIVIASMLAVGGCHSDKKPSSSVITNTVTGYEIRGVNENIEHACGNFPIKFDEIIKEGLASQETMRRLYNEISKKYPITLRGFNVFDHSHAKQQALLMNSLHGVYNDGVPISEYATFTKTYDIVAVFQMKASIWRDNNQCSSLKYEPYVSGHDLDSIRARIKVLNDTVSDLIHGLDAVLKFDYTQFDKQYRPLISQFWTHIYVANRHACDLLRAVNEIKYGLWLVDLKEGF